MTEYIDIEDIPKPYAKWAEIPEGMALEVTDAINGRLTPKNYCGALTQFFRRHPDLGLVVMKRGDRVYVAKPKRTAS